jgi:hypothetical protein
VEFDSFFYADTNRSQEFNENELRFLKMKGFSNEEELVDDSGTITYFVQMVHQGSSRVRGLGREIINVYKEFDSWYYVQSTFNQMQGVKYYKCDQFDGLVSCLKNEFNIS